MGNSILTYFSKKVKLSVDDMEREVYGGELDAAERLLWRRWVENENARQFRKSRVQVTCCGRFRYRYQIERTNMAIGGVMPAGTRCRCADLRLIRHMKQRCQRRIARRMQWKSSTRARNHLEPHQEMPQLDLRLRSRRDAKTGVGRLG